MRSGLAQDFAYHPNPHAEAFRAPLMMHKQDDIQGLTFLTFEVATNED